MHYVHRISTWDWLSTQDLSSPAESVELFASRTDKEVQGSQNQVHLEHNVHGIFFFPNLQQLLIGSPLEVARRPSLSLVVPAGPVGHVIARCLRSQAEISVPALPYGNHCHEWSTCCCCLRRNKRPHIHGPVCRQNEKIPVQSWQAKPAFFSKSSASLLNVYTCCLSFPSDVTLLWC